MHLGMRLASPGEALQMSGPGSPWAQARQEGKETREERPITQSQLPIWWRWGKDGEADTPEFRASTLSVCTDCINQTAGPEGLLNFTSQGKTVGNEGRAEPPRLLPPGSPSVALCAPLRVLSRLAAEEEEESVPPHMVRSWVSLQCVRSRGTSICHPRYSLGPGWSPGSTHPRHFCSTGRETARRWPGPRQSR